MQFRRRGVMLTLLMFVGLVVVPATGSVSAVGFEVEWDESVPVGEVATVRGVVPEGATSVATEVKDGEEWVPAEAGEIAADGGFEIQLTDGVDVEGVSTFRVVAETPDGPVSSAELEVVRTAAATPEGDDPETEEPETEEPETEQPESEEPDTDEPTGETDPEEPELGEPKIEELELEEPSTAPTLAATAVPTVDVTYSASTPAGVLTRVYGRVNGEVEGRATLQVKTSRGWRWSRQVTTNSTGYFAIPLTYGASTPGWYQFRVVASSPGGAIYSDTFVVRRTVGVVASSPSSTPAGVLTKVYGRVEYPGGRARVQVMTSSGWRDARSASTSSTGYFAIPLTYGATTAGTFRFRIAATTPVGTVYSESFRVTRKPGVVASSASSAKVGVVTTAYGRVAHPRGTASVQVHTSSGWRWISSARTSSTGYFEIPMDYAVDKPGRYLFRVGASTPSGVVYSKTFTLTRTGAPSGLGNCSRQPRGKAVMVDKASMRLWLCRDGVAVSGLMPFTSGARYQAPQGIYRVGFERAVWWSVGGAPLYNFTGFAKGVGGGNIGFHRYLGMPENEVGTERWRGASGGCFRMRSLDAQILQGFTDVGTLVHVLSNG